MKKKINTVIISRIDAIGDVVLTFPVATILKRNLGDSTRVLFLGKTYTQPVIRCCDSIDGFLNYDDFKNAGEKGRISFLAKCNADVIIHVFPKDIIAFNAKLAHIPIRIGTTNRLYHWVTCNKLIRLGRKNSDLHEAQLNINLLKPLKIPVNSELGEISMLYNFRNKYRLPETVSSKLSTEKFRLIIHPKSNASAREWKLEHYEMLISLLSPEKFQVIITGGKDEAALLNGWAKRLSPDIINLAGSLSLEELIALTDACEGLIAASTGPLHIAAALGKHALGIFPPIRPMDPRRWAPVGIKAEFIVHQKNCSDCRINPNLCHCINEISAEQVFERISHWTK